MTTFQKQKKIVLDVLGEYSGEVFLYGSRARGDNGFNSDIDIGCRGDENLGDRKYKVLDAIEDSVIPFELSITDFNETGSEPFRRSALKNAIIWKKKN